MTCGIYKITNKNNGHSYIGKSSNCERRFLEHKSKSQNQNKEYNKVLYKAFRKHGINNFDFEIIEKCKEEKLSEREEYWINYYNTYEDKAHYNRAPGDPNAKGRKYALKGERHPSSILTKQEVVFCRKLYAKGNNNPIIVWKKYFKEKIGYSAFCRMYTGVTWKEVMPEVFEKRWGNRRFSEEEKDEFRQDFQSSGLNLHQFYQKNKGYIGYSTLHGIINKDQPKNEKRKGKFTLEDAERFREEFAKSGQTLKDFSKSKKGIIGYGTLWNMINYKGRYEK